METSTASKYEGGGLMVTHPGDLRTHHTESLLIAKCISRAVNHGASYKLIKEIIAMAESAPMREMAISDWTSVGPLPSPMLVMALTSLSLSVFDYEYGLEAEDEDDRREEDLLRGMTQDRNRIEQLEDEKEWCWGTAVSPSALVS